MKAFRELSHLGREAIVHLRALVKVYGIMQSVFWRAAMESLEHRLLPSEG